jgi:hypothetical protein
MFDTCNLFSLLNEWIDASENGMFQPHLLGMARFEYYK